MITYKTRADLLNLAGFHHLDTDSCGNPIVWENHFTCRTCSSEQVDWIDNWSCQCDDECPECGEAVSPYDSIWIGPENQVSYSASSIAGSL